MNIDICELVLLPLPPCVYLSQSEVEVMPTQPWCPLSTRCLSHVASHDLMISLKQLIIRATVCVMPEFIHSFIHSSMCTCITAAALFTAAPHHGSVYVCARLSTRFRAPLLTVFRILPAAPCSCFMTRTPLPAAPVLLPSCLTDCLSVLLSPQILFPLHNLTN